MPLCFVLALYKVKEHDTSLSISIKMLKKAFLLLLLHFLPMFFCQQEEISEQFQYKSITLGVLIDPTSISLPLPPTFPNHAAFSLINSTILAINNNSHPQHGNVTSPRTSSLTLLLLSSVFQDLKEVPDISMLFTMLGCQDSHNLNYRVTQQFGPIVHIAVTDPGCPRLPSSSSITLPLTYLKRNDDLLQLLVDLRSSTVLPGWRETVVVNDVGSGDGIIDAFGQGFSTSLPDSPTITQTLYFVDSMSYKASLADQIEDVLAKYSRSAPGNFIVITKSTNVNRVLEAASRFGMLSVLKQWLFISPDPLEPDFSWHYIQSRIIDDGVNIAFINNSTQSSGGNNVLNENRLYCDTEALLILLSNVVESFAVLELELYLQVSNEEWDIIKPTREERVTKVTANVMEQLSSQVVSACDKNSSTWNLRAGENGKFGKQVFEVGWWNPLTGIRMTDDLLPHVMGGFRGRQISVASMHFPPWQIISRDEEGNVSYAGLLFEILNHMSKDLNFTYKVLEPREGETYGNLQEDGSWTGMMKMVAENKVVITAAAFTITPKRAKYVNFTHVIERESYGFMVNRPQELSRALLFAAPFSPPVWLCILLAVLAVAPILNFVQRSSPYYAFHKKFQDGGLWKMKNCYWYVYGSLLQQGGIHLPEALSGRMLIGFWWLFVIVTVTTYSGNLVAFLTFPKIESPVNTVTDLLSLRGIDSWGFLSGSVIEDHLKQSAEPHYRALYERAIKHPTLNGTVLDMISKKGHAYIDWKIVLLTAIRDALKATGRCEYIIGAETFFEEKIALAVPKNSPYLPIFNRQISQMLQTGLVKKWKSRYWPGKDKCSLLTMTAGNRKVGVKDMQGSFYLLFIGFFISLLVLLGEWILHKKRKSKMTDTIKILVSPEDEKKDAWEEKAKKLTFLR